MVLKYDLVVIGSGSGLDVAVEAAGRGKKVAIIEKGALGGTCLNRGCIPSKIVIHSGDVVKTIREAEKFGVRAELKKIMFKKVTDRANKMVDGDSKSIEKALRSGKNPKLYQGTAKFVGPRRIEVNGKILEGKKVLIAAGARPSVPPIPGLDKVDYMTSTQALRLTQLPKSLIVIGGGYIGVEMGSFYAAMGSKVTVIQRGKLLIPREDRDVALTFTKLWKDKVNLVLGAGESRVEKKGKKVVVHVKVGRTWKKVVGDKLLMATGVRPNSDILDVEKAGIKINKRGFIKVNKYLETSAQGVWALGDIAGVYLFKHSANLEAEYALNNMYGKKLAVDYDPMPHAIFTDPQVAGVGPTEQELEEKGVDYLMARYDYRRTGMGAALAEKDGFVKLLVDRKSRKILGCHILGPKASVLVHQVLIAMKAGHRGLSLLQNTVHIHPALNEVVQRCARQL